MSVTRKTVLALLGAAAAAGCTRDDGRIRIGFVVKQPEEPWFQSEWAFAEKAARDRGFDLIKIGATDGDRVLTAIDNLAAKNAQGFVICAPDPKLGQAILQGAKIAGLKVMSVDDRLIGADGRPLATIPHVGISASAIGVMAGETAAVEARARGWDLASTGLLAATFDSLQTARERTDGARAALLAAGLPSSNILPAPERTTDTEGGFNAAGPVLSRQASIKRWIIVGMNDESVLGAVRAAEGLGFKAADVVAVGIGGSGAATAEFSKVQPSGFFATILLSPRRHGYDTSVAMYEWITRGVRPPPLVYTSGTPMMRRNWRALAASEAA